MSLYKLEKENIPGAVIHSGSVFIKRAFSSNMFCSLPSNLLVFLSLQIHHIKQWVIAFQISMHWWCSKWCCQQSNKSTTLLGITHWIPKRVKTISHNSLANCKVQQQMLHCLLGPLTHTTPTYQNYLTLSQILHCQKVPLGSHPYEKRHFRWDLRLPYTSPRESVILRWS